VQKPPGLTTRRYERPLAERRLPDGLNKRSSGEGLVLAAVVLPQRTAVRLLEAGPSSRRAVYGRRRSDNNPAYASLMAAPAALRIRAAAHVISVVSFVMGRSPACTARAI